MSSYFDLTFKSFNSYTEVYSMPHGIYTSIHKDNNIAFIDFAQLESEKGYLIHIVDDEKTDWSNRKFAFHTKEPLFVSAVDVEWRCWHCSETVECDKSYQRPTECENCNWEKRHRDCILNSISCGEDCAYYEGI